MNWLVRLAVSFSMAQVLASAALAQTTSITSTEIKPQPLIQALTTFADQTGLQLIYVSAIADGQQSRGAPAGLAPAQTLQHLLAGTHLRFQFLNERTVAIRAANDESTSDDASRHSQGDNNAAEGSSEVIVVGSRLGRASDKEQAQPIRVLNRQQIESSGMSSLPDVLSTLPEASTIVPRISLGGGTVMLRGLPAGSTLILINGRRIQGTTGSLASFSSFFDLETIPLSAVERVEVIAAGSSAVYGGDALAGAVNIVLKSDFTGFAGDLQYGGTSGADEKRASVAWGWKSERASFSVVGTYASQSELSADERSFAGKYGYAGPYSSLANIYSVDGGNLPGLTSDRAAVPAGSSGVGLTPANFSGTAGSEQMNLLFASGTLLMPQDRYGAIASAHFDLTADTELFAELLYSKLDSTYYYYPPLVDHQLVPASNPFNPFGTDVLVSYLFEDLGRAGYDNDDSFNRELMGLRGRMGGDWKWEVAAWRSADRERQTALNSLDNAAVVTSLASTDPSLALNLFRDGPPGSPALLASLVYDDPNNRVSSSSLTSGNAFVRGTLFEAAGRRVETVFGVEYARENVEFAQLGAVLDAHRTSYAAFNELRVPLLPGDGREGSGDKIVLSSAVRYDHYSDFGNRLTPQAGLEIRPIKSLLLRGSYSKAFKPPTLYQLYAPVTVINTVIDDPRRGGASTPVESLHGGNPDIGPQTGRSTVLGLVFAPWVGFDVSLTHFDTRIREFSASPFSGYFLEHESEFPQRTIREAPSAADSAAGRPGRILQLDERSFNFGALEVKGVDFTVNSETRAAIGTITATASVTEMYRYEGTTTPGAPSTSHLGIADNTLVFAPRWKGNVSVGWNTGTLQTRVSGRYIGRYDDYYSPPEVLSLGNVWYVDALAQFRVGELFSAETRLVSSLTATLGAVNLFDREPDRSNFFRGFDPSEYDLRGRFVYGRIGMEW